MHEIRTIAIDDLVAWASVSHSVCLGGGNCTHSPDGATSMRLLLHYYSYLFVLWFEGELGDVCATNVDCQEAIENSWCVDDSPGGSSAKTSAGSCACKPGLRQVGLSLCRYCE